MRESPGHGRPLTVVLADDDADAVDLLSKLLISAGYRCLPAPGGMAAYRIFLQAQPDLLVTDLCMPAGDGYTLIERVREERHVPVLAITGRSITQARQRLHGVYEGVEVLGKPFGREKFLSAVAALVRPCPSPECVPAASDPAEAPLSPASSA